MPGAHRHTDDRFCGATTKVVNQSTVKVNGLLWAVEGDIDTHCDQGVLSAVTGALNVYIEGKLVIVAVGDIAGPDKPACLPPIHPAGATNPKGKSPNVIAYGGGAGGGS